MADVAQRLVLKATFRYWWLRKKKSNKTGVSQICGFESCIILPIAMSNSELLTDQELLARNNTGMQKSTIRLQCEIIFGGE